MERRQFLFNTLYVLAFNTISRVIKSVEDGGVKSEVLPKPVKTVVVGVGTAGSKVAKMIYDLMPYDIVYYAIDSEKNADFNDHQQVTFWRKSKLSSFATGTMFENKPDHNEGCRRDVDRTNFMETLQMVNGSIIVVAGLGGNTGSYLSYRLIKQLLQNNKNKIQLVGTVPYSFEGKRYRNRCNNYSTLVKEMGVPITLFDCWESTKGKHLSLTKAFEFMDELLVKNIMQKAKK